MSVMLFDWFITRTQTPRTLPPWKPPSLGGPHPGKDLTRDPTPGPPVHFRNLTYSLIFLT